MALTVAEVQRVAQLARLKLTDHEAAAYAPQLSRILDYVDSLSAVDVANVEPLVQAVDVQNMLRDDVVRKSLPRELALSNAPRQDGKFFLVPQILDAE